MDGTVDRTAPSTGLAEDGDMAQQLSFSLGESPPGASVPEDEAGGGHLYLYANNNNLRHFLSQDAVVCRDGFETDIYSTSVASLFPWGILLTVQECSRETLEQFRADEGVYPVALEVHDASCQALQGLLISREYQARHGDLRELVPGRDVAVLIPGWVPMSSVVAAHFRSQEELDRFVGVTPANIDYNERLFRVSPAVFEGQWELSSGALTRLEDALSQEAREARAAIPRWHRRNRIRASLFASMAGFENRLSEGVSLHFDGVLVELLSRLVGHSRRFAVRKQMQCLHRALAERLTGLGLPVEFSAEQIRGNDGTAFRHWHWAASLIDGGPGDFELETLVRESTAKSRRSSAAKQIDELAYKLVLGMVLESPSQLPAEFLALFQERFQRCIEPLDLPEVPLSSYREALRRIENIEKGYEKISFNWGKGLSTLEALMVFQSAPGAGDFRRLLEKMETFCLPPYLRRVVWSLFGMLHGMAPIGREFKRQREFLRLSEVITSPSTASSLQPTDRPDRQSRAPGGDERSCDGASGRNRYLVVSSEGIELPVTIVDVSRQARRWLLELLGGPLAAEVQAAVLECPDIDVPGRFTLWESHFTGRTFKVVIGEGDTAIQTRAKPVVTRSWHDWDGFRREYLDDRRAFAALFSADAVSSLSARLTDVMRDSGEPGGPLPV